MKHIKSLMEKVGKGEGGFTLIELLIVILILGIIAAVVVLNVGGFFGTGAREAAYMEKDAVQTAVLASMIDGGCDQAAAGDIDTPAYEACTGKPLSGYLQGTIKGTWTINDSGQITGGTYPASGTVGGKTCTWDGTAGTMTCT